MAQTGRVCFHKDRNIVLQNLNGYKLILDADNLL